MLNRSIIIGSNSVLKIQLSSDNYEGTEAQLIGDSNSYNNISVGDSICFSIDPEDDVKLVHFGNN